jgi:hypothetical protein
MISSFQPCPKFCPTYIRLSQLLISAKDHHYDINSLYDNSADLCTDVSVTLQCKLFFLMETTFLESTIFWDITLCSPLNVTRHFGESCHLLSQWFLVQLIFRP